MFSKYIKKRRIWSVGMVLLVLAFLSQAGWQIKQAPVPAGPGPSAASGVARASNPSGATGSADPASGSSVGTSIISGVSIKNDVSEPLRNIRAEAPSPVRKAEEDNENPPIRVPGQKDAPDTVVQRSFGDESVQVSAPISVWNGIGSQGSGGGGCNCAPPDTNGDVGPNNYIQTVNTAFQIWDKNGRSLYGPANINTIWSGFSGACQTRNDGDPVVLYDQLADRWLISQFTSASPYNECIAISTTSDPTGSWNRYAFQLSTTDFPDYPHIGVWPDGYYMTVNWFNNGNTYGGPRPYVFNRTQMLNGQPASFQSTSSALGNTVAPMLPADLDGSTPPPAGAPNVVAAFGNPLKLYKFHVDWANPANTSFTSSSNLSVAGFTQLCSATRNCVPQPGTSQKVDGIGDRLMHRLSYRNMGDHESLVATHSVDAGNGLAGMRWYEIRNPYTSTVLYQQGTYAPDSTYRWMGSAAMNGQGAIALGYSASSSSVYPSIRYTGRVATDPLGTLPQGEGTIYAGTGSQSGVNRWGDYSSMSVDPTDDCTFWYTQEYNNSLNWYWQTKVGSFRIGGCSAGGPTATPTKTATPAPPTNTPTAVPPTATPVPTNTPNPTADFTLSVTPTTRSVARNGSTTYTVNLASSNGFSGNVSLSVSGLPNRTTGTFSPASVSLVSGGTGTSTLTVSTKRQSTTGTYTLTITGTGGGHTHTQTVTLTVTP